MSTRVDPQVRINWRLRAYQNRVVEIVFALVAVHALLLLAGNQDWASQFTWDTVWRSFLVTAGAVVVFALVMRPFYKARVVREESVAAEGAEVQQSAQVAVDVVDMPDEQDQVSGSSEDAEKVVEETETVEAEQVVGRADHNQQRI